MCGIFGHIGPGDSAEICIEGLRALEYRGYDSAGIAGIYVGGLFSLKEIGKLSVLEKSLKETSVALELAIAHTRWATHGVPTKENAHPHFDQTGSIAVVHNGIIENHHALRTMLKEKNRLFSSDTDTEVIAQLVAYFYKGNLFSAVQEALALMQGTWGMVLIHKDHPNQMIAAAKENSLAIALNPATKEAFVASDANAFRGQNLEVTFLQKGDIAVVTADKVEIFDQNAGLVARLIEHFSSSNQIISKNGYDHFMLKEIFEQPHTVQQALHHRIDPANGTAIFEELKSFTETLLGIKHIHILACGTSWHAGCLASLLIEDLARIPCHAEIASEYRCKNPIVNAETLIIAISQSGETLDTIAAVREAKSRGAKVLTLCNVPFSTLVRESDAFLALKAGPEISVCSTKAFTSQLSVLSLFAVYLARMRTMPAEKGQSLLNTLAEIPNLVHQVLGQNDTIRKIAQKYAAFDHFFFLGRHYMFFTALEASLKLKEISYLNATAYPAGEMKHGPIALLDPKLPVVALLGNKRTYDKMLSNLMESKARRAPILAFASKDAHEIAGIADDVIWIPDTADEFAPILYSVAGQLLAYYIALERGTEIDQPRNLAKSVTVE